MNLFKKVKNRRTLALLLALAWVKWDVFAQQDTLGKINNIPEITISASRFEQAKSNVAQQITVISKKQIEAFHAATTADLVANLGNGVFVQKSQQGGGSPVLRGFEANKILLVVDGIRQNNLIMRGGHLQNIITIDQQMMEQAEVLFGASSTIYGSDALGGAICFFTKKPIFSDTNTPKLSVNSLIRHASTANEITAHADINIGFRNFASLTSLTVSQFDDLQMGKNKNPFADSLFGLRPFFVENRGGKDTLITNKNPYLQRSSGYKQLDLMQKILFKNDKSRVTQEFNFQLSTSTNVPRYDRLTDPSAATVLGVAQWYYGPQNRLLAAYKVSSISRWGLDRIQMQAYFQDLEESRNTRNFGRPNISNRTEKVNIIGFNLDAQNYWNRHDIRVGLDGQFDFLTSTAFQKNIVSGVQTPQSTRYPDGTNQMQSIAVYATDTWQFDPKLSFHAGARVGYASLSSSFVNKTFFNLPTDQISQKNAVYSASLSATYRPQSYIRTSLILSSGYRVPNVDDLSKVFESTKGRVVLPNPNLKIEQTLGAEWNANIRLGTNFNMESAIFVTRLSDGIAVGKSTFNGQDSIIYDGVKSAVLKSQNLEKSYIYGFNTQLNYAFSPRWSMGANLQYTKGRTINGEIENPLSHIPPVLGRINLKYQTSRWALETWSQWNGKKKITDYYLGGEDNEQYAPKDGTPAWFTCNLRGEINLYRRLKLQLAVENIFDTQYRTFSSGINAPGRNIIISVRNTF